MRAWSYVKRHWPYWRRYAKTLVLRRRCYECGLLGFYPFPQDSRAGLEQLLELGVSDRKRGGAKLKAARKRGEMKREYDPRRGHGTLGKAKWIHGGVKCGVGAQMGPSTTWARPENFPRNIYARMIQTDASVHYPGSPNPLYPDALAQTFVEQLVRPHDCPQYIRYRTGRTPSQHPDERRQGLRTAGIWMAAIATVGVAIIGWLYF